MLFQSTPLSLFLFFLLSALAGCGLCKWGVGVGLWWWWFMRVVCWWHVAWSVVSSRVACQGFFHIFFYRLFECEWVSEWVTCPHWGNPWKKTRVSIHFLLPQQQTCLHLPTQQAMYSCIHACMHEWILSVLKCHMSTRLFLFLIIKFLVQLQRVLSCLEERCSSKETGHFGKSNKTCSLDFISVWQCEAWKASFIPIKNKSPFILTHFHA